MTDWSTIHHQEMTSPWYHWVTMVVKWTGTKPSKVPGFYRAASSYVTHNRLWGSLCFRHKIILFVIVYCALEKKNPKSQVWHQEHPDLLYPWQSDKDDTGCSRLTVWFGKLKKPSVHGTKVICINARLFSLATLRVTHILNERLKTLPFPPNTCLWKCTMNLNSHPTSHHISGSFFPKWSLTVQFLEPSTGLPARLDGVIYLNTMKETLWDQEKNQCYKIHTSSIWTLFGFLV